MKITLILSTLITLTYSFQGQTKTYKKHDTCVYSRDVYMKDLLYKFSKGELEPKLKIVRRSAQEKCQGVAITNRNPDNGISQCLFYSQIATKGRHKGKRIICVNHACPGTKYQMDESCAYYSIKKRTSEMEIK